MIDSLTVGPIGERCYILPLDGKDDGNACIVVDPGDEAKRILAFLEARRLRPVYVVATHGHLDHTAALPDLFAAWKRAGLSVTLAAHSADAAYFGPAAEETNRRVFQTIKALGFFRQYFRPMPVLDLILEDGMTLPGSTWKVIHTPGHTAGSICLYDEERGVLVAGDTLFKDGVGRTDGPDSDSAALAISIEGRLFPLPGLTRVYPGHGVGTTIARERGENGE